MISLYLLYFKSILKTNIILSVLFTMSSLLYLNIGNTLGSLVEYVLRCFIIAMMTGGFLFGVYYFEITRKNEYYFYYNVGLTKAKLLLMAYLFHLVVMIPFLIILINVKPS